MQLFTVSKRRIVPDVNNYESFLLIGIGIYNILPTWQIHLDISYFSLVFIVFLSFTCSFIHNI